MMPLMELPSCPDLAVPANVMHHVVHVESSFNPYAIGVVGGRLVRQPRNLPEAVATARMLESRGINFSLGLAQVNRYNLARYGLNDYRSAFSECPNLAAGSRILADCQSRARGNWGKAFSCYYSGNFETGYRQGYVQKVFASMREAMPIGGDSEAIPLVATPARTRFRLQAPSRSRAALPPAQAPSWSRRIVTSVSAQKSALDTQSLPPASNEPAPTQSPVLAAVQPDGPVLLNPRSGPPRQTPVAQPQPVAPAAVDSAFVF